MWQWLPSAIGYVAAIDSGVGPTCRVSFGNVKYVRGCRPLRTLAGMLPERVLSERLLPDRVLPDRLCWL